MIRLEAQPTQAQHEAIAHSTWIIAVVSRVKLDDFRIGHIGPMACFKIVSLLGRVALAGGLEFSTDATERRFACRNVSNGARCLHRGWRSRVS
jgi:hypothetical protein